MNIVITGGAGFLGAMLTQTLLKNYSDTIESLTVVDRVAPSNAVTQDPRVRAIVAMTVTDPQQAPYPSGTAPDHHPCLPSRGARLPPCRPTFRPWNQREPHRPA
ncbi:hypothetical protein K6U31_19585, partial [Vibrio fluvialis]|nr:hypothetical protein [Vibrio fluvialis]